MKTENTFQKIKNQLNFSYEIAENPNYDFLVKIFNEDVIRNNYKKISIFNESNNKSSQSQSNNKTSKKPNDISSLSKSNDNIKFIINPKIERINNLKNNETFLFTYDYLLENGLLLELNIKYFRKVLYKFQRALENAINEINLNKKNLGQIANNYGFEFINDLSIFYVNIKDIQSFILSTQLYGEAESMNLNDIIANSISNASKKTSDIVGQSYEDSVLLYFLNNANINDQNILPRLFFYMDFIIFKYEHKNIYIEFIPFNQLSSNKTESYNEMDFSFYTTKNIQIPMLSMKYQIFTNTYIYNHKEETQLKNYKNTEIIFPENTLTFFEMKNDISRIDGKIIDLDNLISKIKTFLSKLPIYLTLYKSKNFINENCNNIKFILFYDHLNGQLQNSNEAKILIKKEINEKFKNANINIDIQIIFGSKQIQSINYVKLFLENKSTKEKLNQTNEKLNNTTEELNNAKIKLNNTTEELNNAKIKLNNTTEELNNTKIKLNQTNDKLNKLEQELENMKKILTFKYPNDKNECIELETKKEEIIELDETKINFNKEIDNYKKNFKDIKLKIFEKAISMPDFLKYFNKNNEEIEIIKNLSEKLTTQKLIGTSFNEKQIENIASQLIKKIIKKNN